jgi:hypothetical protein
VPSRQSTPDCQPASLSSPISSKLKNAPTTDWQWASKRDHGAGLLVAEPGVDPIGRKRRDGPVVGLLAVIVLPLHPGHGRLEPVLQVPNARTGRGRRRLRCAAERILERLEESRQVRLGDVLSIVAPHPGRLGGVHRVGVVAERRRPPHERGTVSPSGRRVKRPSEDQTTTSSAASGRLNGVAI